MWPRFKRVLMKRLRLKETWILFFILGIIMLNFPFLHIFNKPAQVAGFPLMFLYLLIGWPVSIFVIYLFEHAMDVPDENDSDRKS